MLARAPAVLRANAAEHDMLAAPAGTVSVRTGEADRVACGGKRLTVENGHPLMARVTGTGCLSGAVTAAFLAVEDDAFVAAASAMLAIGVAAEMAAEAARGPGSFEPALLDALAALGSIDIVHRARIGHGEG